MITYWTNLNDRERATLGIGVTCTLIYLLYILIFSPLNNAVIEKSRQLNEKKETLVWLQETQKEPLGKKDIKKITSSKLLTIIATQLSSKPFQKFPHQIQQTSQEDIQLTFDAVPYKPFLNWLWTLSTEYSITLKQINFEMTETEGTVRVTLVIAAAL